MAKKKLYNPFKMWGSYVGAIIGLIYQIGTILSLFGKQYIFFIDITLVAEGNIFLVILGVFNLIMMIIGIVIGTLIGWGIHGLIRRLRK